MSLEAAFRTDTPQVEESAKMENTNNFLITFWSLELIAPDRTIANRMPIDWLVTRIFPATER